MSVLLDRLSAVYGRPKETDDIAGFTREYERAVQNYTESELDEAAAFLLRTRKYKTWPTVGECVTAAEQARQSIRARMAAKYRQPTGQSRKYTHAEMIEARKFADDCAKGKVDLGFCAAKLRSLAKAMQARRGRS